MREHIRTLLTVITLCQCQQARSVSNHVRSESESSSVYVDQLDWSAGEARGQTNINLSSKPLKYCNDYRNIQGHEGSPRPGFTLRQVHIILTPGPTSSPIETSDHELHMLKPSCQILTDPEDSHKIHSFEEASAIYSVVQHDKHGFKHFHPVFKPTCTDTYLTDRGFKQSISSGEHLVQSYFSNTDSKLKPVSDNIQTESITEQESYHGLLAFLHGFLPEKVFANTKVHKASGNFCKFSKQSNISCHCRTANYLYKPVWQSLVKGQFLFKDAYVGTYMINSVFKEISTINLSLLELFQAMMFHVCDNVIVMCDKNNHCINITVPEHIDPVHQLVSGSLQTVSQDATFHFFSQLYSFPFLYQLVTKADNWRSTEQIHAYSGDSFFLHVLLSSLGIRFEGPIPMASRLVFEVYQKNRGQPNGSMLYFNLIYNGEDVTDHLKFCDGRLEEGLCSLQRLTEEVTDLKKIYQENC